MKCGTFYDVHTIKDSYGIPICSCGGMIKPDVVLYEEALGEMVIKQSISAGRFVNCRGNFSGGLSCSKFYTIFLWRALGHD